MRMHSVIFAYILLAPLGYWVMQHAAKQKDEPCVKRAGLIVAYALMAISLLGVLCGLWGHMRAYSKCRCGDGMMMQVDVQTMRGGMHGQMGGQGGMGMMGMGKNCPMHQAGAMPAKTEKTEAPAPKAK